MLSGTEDNCFALHHPGQTADFQFDALDWGVGSVFPFLPFNFHITHCFFHFSLLIGIFTFESSWSLQAHGPSSVQH